MSVLVIGAGPAGLAAAYELARAGRRPIVLEAADAVGGLSGSFDLCGFKVDYGPHRLHMAATGEVFELYKAALGSALRERVRSGVVHLGGRRLPYPLSLAGLWRGLGLGGALYGMSAVWARVSRPGGQDFGAEAARRLGRRAARLLYEPAARKVWGVDPAELDVALGKARVQKGSPWAVLRAALGRGGSSAGRRYFYPEQGAGELAEGLAARIRELGGEIRCGVRAEGLVVEQGRVRGVVAGGETLRAESVIASVPLPRLCTWAGAGEAAEGLGYRGLVLLYVVLGTDRGTPHDVHYFADERIPANRLFEMKGFSGGAGPSGRTALGFDIPCTPGDALWNASSEQLVEKVRPALAAAGLADAPVLEATVRRVEAAYPIYRKGYAEKRDRALDALSKVEGLYPVGRHALFVHDNVHHACAAGLAAGRAAAAGESAAAWRGAQRPFLHAQIED